MAFAGLLLAAVAAAVFARYAIHGGFSADDWAFAESARWPAHMSFHDIFARINPDPERPLQDLYFGLNFFVFGIHPTALLASGMAMGIVASMIFYVALRTLGLPTAHAWLLATLALLFPYSDSTKLWFTASSAQLSVALYFGGLSIAVHALRARTMARSVGLHAASATLYALSIMSYEITAPLVVASVVAYVFLAPWRRAAMRWVLDLAVTAAVLGLITIPRSPKTIHGGLSNLVAHGKAVVAQGSLLFSQSIFPFYSTPERRLAIAMSATVLLLGLLVFWLLPRRDRDRRVLKEGLLVAGGGLLVTIAGWTMLLPADLGYSPGAVGNGNRINVVAAFGLVPLVYGLLMIVGVMVFRGLRPGRGLPSALVAVMAIVVGAGYVYRLTQDIQTRERAAGEQTAVLTTIHRDYPRLPSGSTVYVTGYTAETGYDVPAFDLPWDLQNAVRIEWRDHSLTAWPLAPATQQYRQLSMGSQMVCTPAGVGLSTDQAPVQGESARYGTAYLVSYRPGFASPIDSRRTCLQLTARVAKGA